MTDIILLKKYNLKCLDFFVTAEPCLKIFFVILELDAQEDSACVNVEITKNKTLKGGTRAGKFHSMGKKDMKKCITECCGRPNCDIAYQLNGHCYSVECSDGKLCQATNEPTKEGDNIQLAYMNKNGLDEKKRGIILFCAIFVIIHLNQVENIYFTVSTVSMYIIFPVISDYIHIRIDFLFKNAPLIISTIFLELPSV